MLQNQNTVGPATTIRYAAQSQALSSRPNAINQNEQLAEIDELAVAVDWTRPRTYWLMYGPHDKRIIKDVIKKITKCSKLIVAQTAPSCEPKTEAASDQQIDSLVEAGRLSIITPDTPETVATNVLALIDINSMDGWKPIIFAQTLKKYPREAKEVFRAIGAGINSRKLHKSTLLKMTPLFLRNAFINAPLAYTINPLSSYSEKIKNRPALIVAAGPSLNKQIKLLSENQDLFTIIAVDTVWPILNKHGIKPDIMLTLDAVSKISWQGKKIDNSTHFFVDVGCSPDVVWSHDRNHRFTTCNPITFRPLSEIGVKADFLRTGGSVATSAYSMARFLGANPIVFIGQDLALTDGKDHADGYLHPFSGESLNKRIQTGIDVDSYYGGTVKTTNDFLFYKTWYEQQFATLNDNTMIINSTEGGANIRGAIKIPFRSVCQELRVTSLRKPELPSSGETIVNSLHLEELERGVAKLHEKIIELRGLATKGIDITTKKKSRVSTKLFRQIDELNDVIRNFDANAKILVDAHGTFALENVRYSTHIKKGLKTIGDSVEKYRLTYDSIKAAADKSLLMLDNIADLYRKIRISGQFNPKFLDKPLGRGL